MSGQRPPVLSPVDYDAWNRGYMPPTEHVLIDALSFRGAKVVTMSSGADGSIYVVTQGKPLDKHTRAVLRQLLEVFEEAPAPTPAAPAEPTPATPQDDGRNLADANTKKAPTP